MTVEWKGPEWLKWTQEHEWRVAKIFNRVTEVYLSGTYATDENLSHLASFAHLRRVVILPMRDDLEPTVAQFKAARPTVKVNES